MAFNGSGTFLINTSGQPVVPNTVISATAFNALTNDLANGLSTCITKDGQTTPTANIPMGNNKITGLAPGTSGTDAANLSQVQGSTAKLLQSVTGTDTITAAMVPALTAYAAGQLFYFVAAGDNTGAVTINIDSLGAKNVTRDGSTALVAGDIVSGEVAVIVYDGTRFQLLNGNSFTNLNVSNNLTLSAGTANGVLYLNASKVATSGSALTFDGTNLGVGTASPSARLTILTPTSDSTVGFNLRAYTTGADGDRTVSSRYTSSSDGNWANSKYQAWSHIWETNGTEKLRLDSSGNLGIGTASPGNKLTINSSGAAGIVVRSADSNFSAINIGVDPSNYTYIDSAKNGTGTARPLAFFIDGSERMRLDTSGNLGLGVTPSAWGSSYKAIQLPAGAISADSTAVIEMRQNSLWTGSANVYVNNGFASNYYQYNGTHAWFTAPSGTAGNAITFTQALTLDASGNLGVGATSPSVNGIDIVKAGGTATYVRTSDGTYSLLSGVSPSLGGGLVGTTTNHPVLFYTNNTERARITSGGDLLVGTTAAGARLCVDNSGANVAAFSSATWDWYCSVMHNKGTTNDNLFVQFGTEGTFTGRGSITYNRAGGLVAYNTTSDYRAKDIIGPVQNVGEIIDALKVYEGVMKGATQSRPMLIAHEAQEHAPYAVTGEKDAVNDNGDPVYQQMDTSSLVPLLIAEIQSLRSRVAALEAK